MVQNKDVLIATIEVSHEKRLWIYVMDEAFRTLKKGSPLLKKEAYNWFFSDSYPQAINSFLGVCETLDLEPNKVRKRIKQIALPEIEELPKKKKAKKGTVLLTALGESKTIEEWSKDPRCAVNLNTITKRVYVLKWKHRDAILTPPSRGRYRKKIPENVLFENKLI